jgi:hypothetical protein
VDKFFISIILLLIPLKISNLCKVLTHFFHRILCSNFSYIIKKNSIPNNFHLKTFSGSRQNSMNYLIIWENLKIIWDFSKLFNIIWSNNFIWNYLRKIKLFEIIWSNNLSVFDYKLFSWIWSKNFSIVKHFI